MIEEARSTKRGSKYPLELLKAILAVFAIICVTGLFSELFSSLLLKDGDDTWKDVVILYSEIFGIGTTIFYCTVFEKRSIHSVGFRKPFAKEYGIGCIVGTILFSTVVLLGVICGGFCFCGLNKNINVTMQLLLLAGFAIQGMSEEVLCRGFVFISLARKNSIFSACLGNAILFGLMHIFNEGFSFIPFINLTLFGILETLVVMKTDKIWMASAIHSIWNYMQGCIWGLSVSGDSIGSSIFTFEQSGSDLVSGGAFGPEGGLPVTIVLSIGIIFLLKNMQSDYAKNSI